MGRFHNKVSATTKERSSKIIVNRYELPEKALAAIASICTKQNKDNASIIFGALMPILFKKDKSGNTFFDLIDHNRSELSDIDFLHTLNEKLKRIELELSAHENTNDTQVVVAGGFSAGKSSFLNKITGAENLLPTGIEPVSMISTYLYFSDKVKEVVVKGVNLKQAVVLLDKDVLQSIQHSSSSKVYLASVLDKLFVEMPSKELKGLVFIDTPGYNNSKKANDANGQSDQDTATASFKDGNVLFWLIDGTTVSDSDKTMINQFLEDHEGDGKVVIIFNKADKYPIETLKESVESTAIKFGFGKDKRFIDILAYSSAQGTIHYSKRGFSMPQLLDEVRKSGNGHSGVTKCLEQIKRLFDKEIEFANMRLNESVKERKGITEKKDKSYQRYIKLKEECNKHIEDITSIMVESYDEVLNAANRFASASSDTHKEFIRFYNGVMDFENNDHWGSSSILNRALSSGSSAIDKCADKIDSIRYEYYYQDYRRQMVTSIRDEFNKLNNRYKDDYDRLAKLENETSAKIKKIEMRYNSLVAYKEEILDTLKKTIRAFQYGAHQPQDARLPKVSNTDIFTAISSGNHSQFMDCFTTNTGVSLNTYSSSGFSPLTHAVKEGAINMVRFFISHNADITALDKNGYNAFHVAVIYGYRNICELLLQEEPSIANSLTAKGKNAIQLLEERPFNAWLKSNI